MKTGDWVYFEYWWCHSHVFAKVIEIDGPHFRLWFPNQDLEKINQEDLEWYRSRHITKVLREVE